MTSEQLLDLLGELNDDVVCDALSAVPVKPKMRMRRLVAIAVAAALIFAMSITAVGYFSGAEWYETYFSWGRKLTEQQNEYVSNAMVTIDQSVTVNGWTITVDQGMTDGAVALLGLTLEAPEDIDLTQVTYGFESFHLKNEDSTVSNMTGSKTFSEKEIEGPSNIGVFSLRIDNDPTYRSFSLAAGKTCVLTIENIYLSDPETFEHLQTIEGVWEFTFAFPVSAEPRELIEEPVISESGRVEITSCKLSPLGLWIVYNAESAEAAHGVVTMTRDEYTAEAFRFNNPTVVMNDGTEYRGGGPSASATSSQSGYWGDAHFSFHVPLMPEEVDYILLNDGTKIDIN